MNIFFRKAETWEAPILTETRRKAWDATYRGIYPDEMIDQFDFSYYLKKDEARIMDPKQLVFLLMDGDRCGGYLCVGSPAYGAYKDFGICLNALYLLPDYQGRGFGRQAFEIVSGVCRQKGFHKFFCGCNAHNYKARSFYGYMGGHLGAARIGHRNKALDQVYFEFSLDSTDYHLQGDKT